MFHIGKPINTFLKTMLDFDTHIKVYDFYFTIDISHCVFCFCILVNYTIFTTVATVPKMCWKILRVLYF